MIEIAVFLALKLSCFPDTYVQLQQKPPRLASRRRLLLPRSNTGKNPVSRVKSSV
jgi:hypothetical protein